MSKMEAWTKKTNLDLEAASHLLLRQEQCSKFKHVIEDGFSDVSSSKSCNYSFAHKWFGGNIIWDVVVYFRLDILINYLRSINMSRQ